MKHPFVYAAAVLIVSLVVAGVLTIDRGGSISKRSILEFLGAAAICVTIASLILWAISAAKSPRTPETEQGDAGPCNSLGPPDAELRSAILEIVDLANGASAQLYALFAMNSDEIPPDISLLDRNLEGPTRIVEQAASLRPEARTQLRDFLDAQKDLYENAAKGVLPDTASYREKARTVLDRLGSDASPTDRPDRELVRRSLKLIKDLTGDPLLGVKVSSGRSTVSFQELRTETVTVTTDLEMASSLTTASELRAAADLITDAFFMQVEMHNFHMKAGCPPVTQAQEKTLRGAIESLNTSEVQQGLLDCLN